LAAGYNLGLYTLQGKRIADLTPRLENRAMAWDLGMFPTGVYVLVLKNNGRSVERRLVLLR
jgi:hypothetical protein